MDRTRVERAPHPIDAADAVQDRTMRVQLRIPHPLPRHRRPRRAMPKLGNHEPTRLDPTNPTRTSPGVARMRIQVLERRRNRVLVRVDHRLADMQIG